MAPLGAFSQAWVSVEASLPQGWRIMSLTRDEDAERWTAYARGPLQPTDLVTGKGDHPAQALARLADALRERRGPVTG
jgi:hypothetical protein